MAKEEVLGYYRPLGPWDAWYRKLLLLLGVVVLLVVCFEVQEKGFKGSSKKVMYLLKENPITEDWYEDHDNLKKTLALGAAHPDSGERTVWYLDQSVVHLRDTLELINQWDFEHHYGPFLAETDEVFRSLEFARQRVKYHYGLNAQTMTEVRGAVEKQEKLMRLFIERGGGQDLFWNMVNYYYRGKGRRR